MRFALLFATAFFCLSLGLQAQSRLCLTFDDGSVDSVGGYAWPEWNAMLLQTLERVEVKAAFFVCGKRVDSPAGDSLVQSWSEAGHLIANHTYSHAWLNSDKVSAANFVADIRRNDSIVRGFKTFVPLFRFPYLKEGNTAAKRDSLRAELAAMGYRNGHVTIDASDWYYNSRLIKHLANADEPDLATIRRLYLAHMLDRAQFYDSLAFALEGRRVAHTLLMHHNLINALFLDDLIAMFRAKGWEVIDADTAYMDPIYRREPDIVPAGESLIWSLAKISGRFDDILRYPAEDGQYEADVLDAAGY